MLICKRCGHEIKTEYFQNDTVRCHVCGLRGEKLSDRVMWTDAKYCRDWRESRKRRADARRRTINKSERTNTNERILSTA